MNAAIRRRPVLIVATVAALTTLAGCARPQSTPASAHPVIDYAVDVERSPQDLWQARYEAHAATPPSRTWAGGLAKR